MLPAATPNNSLYVHVPFEFVAAGQSFSPGDYHIQRGDNGLIIIQGNGKAAATISVPGASTKPGAPTGLTFSSDGQREHLVSVQVEGEAIRSIISRKEESRKVVLSSR